MSIPLVWLAYKKMVSRAFHTIASSLSCFKRTDSQELLLGSTASNEISISSNGRSPPRARTGCTIGNARGFGNFQSPRVETDVAHQFEPVDVPVAKNRFVAILKQVADLAATAVVTLSVALLPAPKSLPAMPDTNHNPNQGWPVWLGICRIAWRFRLYPFLLGLDIVYTRPHHGSSECRL